MNTRFLSMQINQAPFQVQGTVRIFLAPTKGSDGKPLTLEQQQDFIFILEIFNHNCKLFIKY